MPRTKSKEQDQIAIIGARVHNLKDIDLALPRNQLVVITGVSGSGKSSLAFDTIYAEGQRRYMETFSAYARQFIGQMERPDVEKITGLSPVISIEQKTTNKNPRSTVGTVTEVYDFLRLLYARAADAYSYVTGKKMVSLTDDQIVETVLRDFTGKKISILAPLVRARKGHYRELFDHMRRLGFSKARVNSRIMNLSPAPKLDRYKTHDIELVVDRISLTDDKEDRFRKSLELAMKMGEDSVLILDMESDQIHPFSRHLMCPVSGISYQTPSPNNFSFNSPYGACPTCNGLGSVTEVDLDLVIPDDKASINQGGIAPLGEVRDNAVFRQLRKLANKYDFTFSTPIRKIPKKALDIILYGGDSSLISNRRYSFDESNSDIGNLGLINLLKRWHNYSSSEKMRQWAEDFMTVNTCPDCQGYRLNKVSLHFKLAGKHIGELAEMDLETLESWLTGVQNKLKGKQAVIAKEVLKEILFRLRFLNQVGLGYLNLNRPARTLSGGEAQRIRLATQIGSQLTGITYVLDEPSIGLHQRDNHRLIDSLRQLTRIGNSVIVVEHDKDIMLASDYLVDLGPGAGKHGGQIVAAGPPASFKKHQSLTAQYINNKLRIPLPKRRRKGSGKKLILEGATGNNLKNVTLTLPLGTFICVTGVSGSGKSSLINDTLYPILRKHFHRSLQKPLPYRRIRGLKHLDKVIEVDQSPIGRTPRSNPATYTGVFTHIRQLFAKLPEAKIRGYKPGRFSFNVEGGRCTTCNGSGMRIIEMNFLPDVHVECESCLGRRYNRETLEIVYKGKTINDVLNLTVSEAVRFFEHIPQIHKKLKTLEDVGLGYITLGQQATTLSGGEAQRVKLASELSRRDTGNTLYILDEPTTGLHFDDIRQLINVLNKLVEKGNTVIVIEHNLDVIKMADHIIDIGPEGGARGGQIVATGTPEQIARKHKSHTAAFLKRELETHSNS